MPHSNTHTKVFYHAQTHAEHSFFDGENRDATRQKMKKSEMTGRFGLITHAKKRIFA